MSPTVRRTLVSILVVGALSITLFAAPAHAVGARDSQWQDTASWSFVSLDYWLDFARSLFGVHQGGDAAAVDSSPERMGTVFERSLHQFEPDGVYATGTEPALSETLTEGSN